MGCDIHWHSETRRNGVWVCDQAASFQKLDPEDGDGYEMDPFPNRDRDYWWFGLLNGVRTNWAFMFPESETVPNDLSHEVRTLYEQWDCDAHSAGSLTRAELKAKLGELKPMRAAILIHAHDEKKADATEAQVIHLYGRLEETIANLSSDVPDEDQRIVFWFDN